MFVTEFGIVTLVRLLQLLNDQSISVMESGITNLVSPLQPENAQSPIFVTEFGIVTLVRLLQPKNAESPIFVTESGIVTFVRPPGTATNVCPSWDINKPFIVL